VTIVKREQVKQERKQINNVDEIRGLLPLAYKTVKAGQVLSLISQETGRLYTLMVEAVNGSTDPI
jgi:hypothetical protein